MVIILLKIPPRKNNKVAEFSRLVEGKEPWEVCRYFLSSLLLTNYGNLEIVSRDPLVFKLKSKIPDFDAAKALERVQEQQEQKSDKKNKEQHTVDQQEQQQAEEEQGQDKTTNTEQNDDSTKGKKRSRKQRNKKD